MDNKALAHDHLSVIGASAAKPHMVVTSGIFGIIMDLRLTNLIQRTCACSLLSKIEEELLVNLQDYSDTTG